MFFYLSKILPLLLSPLPLFLIFCIFSAIFIRLRFLRILLITFSISFWISASHAFSDILLRSLENQYPQILPAEAPEADSIIVLGGMTQQTAYRQGNPEFSAGVDRLITGVDLLRENKADQLIISGGSGLILQRGLYEADVLRIWLIERGYDAEKIIAENSSRNTAENAHNSLALLPCNQSASQEENQPYRILLVTSAFHMPRSMAVFQKANNCNVEIIPVPTDFRSSRFFPGPEVLFPSPGGLLNSTIALKEYIGYFAYSIQGFI